LVLVRLLGLLVLWFACHTRVARLAPNTIETNKVSYIKKIHTSCPSLVHCFLFLFWFTYTF
jgi:hypothetical protein